VNCVEHGVIVGGRIIVGIVLHMVLLWEGALLWELCCTYCYCGRELYWGIVVHMVLLCVGTFWGNCAELGVIVGGSKIGGIALNMLLLWEGAILGKMLYKSFYGGREQYWCKCFAQSYCGREQFRGNFCSHFVTVRGSNNEGVVVYLLLLWAGA
jgi:uncharacterized membrane protein YeaQ/YmgE (transglycosylase-associated protein family)